MLGPLSPSDDVGGARVDSVMGKQKKGDTGKVAVQVLLGFTMRLAALSHSRSGVSVSSPAWVSPLAVASSVSRMLGVVAPYPASATSSSTTSIVRRSSTGLYPALTFFQDVARPLVLMIIVCIEAIRVV